jgi:DNA-binding CsgD family transcriptional regulator
MPQMASLANRVYEASVVQQLWPGVLRDIARIANAKEAVLTVANGDEIRSIGSSKSFEHLIDTHYSYLGGHERTRRLISKQISGFVTDRDLFTVDEILSLPVFTDFLIPNGYGSGIATAVEMRTGESVIFHAEASYSETGFSREVVRALNSLRPHLARSSLLSARLREEQARGGGAKALEAMGLPAAFLDMNGRLLAANGLLHPLIPGILQDRFQRVTLTNSSADALLKAAILALSSDSPRATVCSIPLPRNETMPPHIVHLLPVRGDARDVFIKSTIILMVTPVVAKKVPSATVIQALFDLTPAEARIAHELGNGGTVETIANLSGISVNTVRNQIASVLSKCGLHRRVDLVALLHGTSIGAEA